LRRVEGLLLRFQSRQDGFQTELERVQTRVRALEAALAPAAPGLAPGLEQAQWSTPVRVQGPAAPGLAPGLEQAQWSTPVRVQGPGVLPTPGPGATG
jgi:hypothetical protein